MQVAEELALSLAEMQFVCAYWLLYLVPHTQKWPANVERHVSRGQCNRRSPIFPEMSAHRSVPLNIFGIFGSMVKGGVLVCVRLVEASGFF